MLVNMFLTLLLFPRKRESAQSESSEIKRRGWSPGRTRKMGRQCLLSITKVY